MSLRGRLLVATLVLVTLGLLAADGVTYGLLRSSLFGRVDRQLQLLASGALRAPRVDFGSPAERDRVTYASFAELLDGSGNSVSAFPLSFGRVDLPKLPPRLPGASAAASQTDAQIFTARGAQNGVRYRVLAAPVVDGGTLVVGIPLADVDATLHRLMFVEGGATAAVLIAVGLLALWLVKIGLRPLEEMGHTADAIAAGDLSKRVEPADGRTEVGRLGIALNAMLERIETAFAARAASEARLRRFIGDASHELRTPLTSIRGYAELFRRGAKARPDDLAKSMRRIEEESARMGTLVDELLLLARLDQGRPLERAPVDLARVATDAVEDARVIQPDRSIEIETPDALVVEGDEARLRQVVANLVGNALVHTPAEAKVRVRAVTAGAEAFVEVSDTGPGLSDEDAKRVFDRFYRVDTSRSRESGGGVGLGLSIVAAIAEAHGGRVWVNTAPGAGATFTVALPIVPAPGHADAPAADA
jgi:two-component system, OmpR family, sensor kinase